MTLYHSTFGWFDAPSCKTTSVGQAYNCFPPSQIKHAALVYTDVLLLGTLSCVGDLKELTFQTAKKASRLNLLIFLNKPIKVACWCFLIELTLELFHRP